MPIGLLQIAGVACAVAGIALLRQAWQRKKGNPLRVMAGWGLILGCILLWGYTSGPDKGPALGIVVATLTALGALAYEAARADIRPARELRARKIEASRPSARGVLARFGAFLLMGPVSGLSALAICTASFAVMRSFGVEHTLNLTLVSFAFPLIWGSLGVFVAYSETHFTKMYVILAMGLVPFAFLIVTP